MIKILITDEKKKEIENFHWDYFERNGLSILKEKSKSRSDKLRTDFYKFILDESNNNKRIKDIIVGSPFVLKNLINEINIYAKDKSRFKDYDFKTWDEKIANTKTILPKNIAVTLPKVADYKKEIENYVQYIDELKAKYRSFGEITSRKKAVKLISIIKKELIRIEKHNESCKVELSTFKKNLFQDLDQIFKYDKFVDEFNGWGAYELTKVLGTNTCPYCNRQFIHTSKNSNGKTRPELDHFFNKSEYPYLAVSIYNLIPSCHICNSNLKGFIDFYEFPHINPYEESFSNDGVFKTNIKADKNGNYPIEYFYGICKDEDFDLHLEIKTNSPLRDKIANSNETFKIEDLYQFHKDYVLEIIKKTAFYNKTRIIELAESDLYKSLFSGRDEIIQILIGNYINENELNKRVLAKLTKDIWEEFRLDDVWNFK